MMRIGLMLCLAALFGASGVRAEDYPLGPVYFGDWRGLCDGASVCTSLAYASYQADPGYVLVRSGPKGARAILFGRNGRTSTPWRAPLTFRIEIVDADGRVTWSKAIAGRNESRTFLRAEIAKPRDLVRAEAALRTGQAVRLSIDGEPEPATVISLNGVARNLAWAQDHAKTVTGRPILRRAPRISQTGLPKTPPASVQPCEDGGDPPVAARLGRDQTLWLTACGVGYNRDTRITVTDDKGALLPTPAIAPPLGQPFNPLDLQNLDYAPATRTLTTTVYNNATRSCGVLYAWIWDGAAFRFFTDRYTADCQGLAPEDWPSGYRATVIDR